MVLVPVPMAQESEAVTTLLQVCGIDTKTTNKQGFFVKGDGENAINNTQSKTALAISSA